MDNEFEKGAEQFKRDIKSGKIKVTPDLIGRFAQIFAIPTLKLKKNVEGNPQDPPFKINKPSKLKRGLIKVNLFNKISW
jgi:hypothetical protein